MKFWQAIEDLPGQAAVEAHWRALIGAEFDTIQPLLQLRAELATSFPRLQRSRFDLPLRVVMHGPGDYVGICDETGESTPLQKSDLLVYEVNRPRLLRRLAEAFGVHRAIKIAGSDRACHLGDRTTREHGTVAIYLTIPSEPTDFTTVANTLASEVSTPFVLLAPTRRRLERAAGKLIQANDSLFLALADAVAILPGGLLKTLEPLETSLTRSRAQSKRRASPQTEANVVRFIPTELQQSVLNLLRGQALTLDALAAKLNEHRSRVHRDGIKELQKRGSICNLRRVGGYYRPDAPPPKYAIYLKEQ